MSKNYLVKRTSVHHLNYARYDCIIIVLNYHTRPLFNYGQILNCTHPIFYDTIYHDKIRIIIRPRNYSNTTYYAINRRGMCTYTIILQYTISLCAIDINPIPICRRDKSAVYEVNRFGRTFIARVWSKIAFERPSPGIVPTVTVINLYSIRLFADKSNSNHRKSCAI